MRNIMIILFALIFGAVAANAHGLKGSCRMAKHFLKHNGAGIEALLNKDATGHLKTLQDIAKVKVDFLQKAVALDPPIPFLCRKALKKVEKVVKLVALMAGDAATPAVEAAPADAAPADAQTTPKAEDEPAAPPVKVKDKEKDKDS